MRLRRYTEFTNEEVNIKKALIGGAIGASALVPTHSEPTEPVKPPYTRDTTASAVDKSAVQEVINFVDTLHEERPSLFMDKTMVDGARLKFGQYERLSFLRGLTEEHERHTGAKLDLDLITSQPHGFPFNINYFLVRGLDDIENGPVLIQILRLDFTAAVNIGNHEVMFNFTRVQDVNTFGAKINF